jgi:hypothetical protein
MGKLWLMKMSFANKFIFFKKTFFFNFVVTMECGILMWILVALLVLPFTNLCLVVWGV